MWWEKLIPQGLIIKSSILAVEVVFKEDNAHFFVVNLNEKKGKLQVGDFLFFNELSDFVGYAKQKKIPLILSFTGRGVVNKKIIFEKIDSLDLGDLTKQFLPGVNLDDVLVQFTSTSTTSGFLSFTRKELVNEVLNKLELVKVKPVKISVSAFDYSSLVGLLNNKSLIHSSAVNVTFQNETIENIDFVNIKEEETYLIGGLEIPSNYSLAFASGLTYFQKKESVLSDSYFQNLLQKHFEGNVIKSIILFFVILLFIISGFNSVVFFQEFELNTKLKTELNLYETKHNQIIKQLDSYQKKKKIIEKSGVLENKKLSEYSDKIAMSVPDNVVLRELSFNPLIESESQDSLMLFEKNTILIKGNCDKSLVLNEWINVLKSKDFVKNINLENFVFETYGSVPNFLIKIEIK